MNNYNPYVRIRTYYSLLSFTNPEDLSEYTNTSDSNNTGFSLCQIHKLTNIPLDIVKQDFLCIFQWYSSLSKNESIHLDHEICFNENSEEYKKINEQYDIESLYWDKLLEGHFPSSFEELLKKDIFNQIPLYIDTKNESYEISLSPETFTALQNFLTDVSDSDADIHPFQSFTQTNTYPYAIKDSYLYIHHYKDLNETLLDIHTAIEKGYYTDIKYMTPKGKILPFHIHPIKIAYDTDENLYSILYIEKNKIKSIRLDLVQNLKLDTKTTFTPDSNYTRIEQNLMEIIPNVWGNLFSDAPTHVKVKFYNEARVWEKVRQDLAIRTNGKLYEKNGFLYYEDTVYGISKFKTWIRSYGSSAIVLEPKQLRQEIIASLQARRTTVGND